VTTTQRRRCGAGGTIFPLLLLLPEQGFLAFGRETWWMMIDAIVGGYA